MKREITEKMYEFARNKVEELLKLVDDNTPTDSPEMIELCLMSDIVEAYELEHYPIDTPSLTDVMKLRMYEMNLTQAKLAEIIGVSSSRVSEYLSGKREPTLQVARNIHHKLHIDSSIILG
uniref:helix-turn-helix domain-containing protein n=1 Tax=Ornithobacterium rhinotracheale TaxID=28251 RepID=UPI0039A435D5